ncbi:MAG: MATE family efflux transporter [Bacteroidetes bacterium]|nr:MATE family efflux transporter [Bacteroidota bacterium]
MLDIRYRTILGVALPLMVSSFIQSIVLITDSAFISRFDTLAFDAVGNGGLIFVTVYVALLGIGDGAQILIARRVGQNKIDSISKIFSTSITVLFIGALFLFILLYFFMPDWILSYSKSKIIADYQGRYLKIRSYALFASVLTLAIQAFYLAIGKTWVVLVASLLVALCNIVLDYTLIFGNFSFPKMGLEGAAWASTFSDGLGALFLVVFTIFSNYKKEYKLFKKLKINWLSFKELLNIGSPLMFQGLTALATWTIFFIWIEQIGSNELTVSQNIRSLYMFAFVPIWGFAGTTKTYISQYMGRSEFDSIPIIQKRIQLITVILLFFTFHGSILYPESLIKLVNPNETYITKSAEILRFVSISIFLYGFVSVYFQTINGSGNTIFSMAVEMIAVLIYLSAAFVFIKILHFDILWIWSVEYIYFGTIGLLSYFYLKRFNWRKKII